MPRRHPETPPEIHPQSPEGRGAGAPSLAKAAPRDHRPASWPVEISPRSRIAELFLVLAILFVIALIYAIGAGDPEVAHAAGGGSP